ncbi:MAG TPA: TldD/PmbA family protein [Armatimonadota bacterium]|jgi:TldD protein
MRELIEEVLETAKRAGAQFADLRIGEGSGLNISVQDGQADRISTGSGRSAGLRVLVDGAWGFAPTTEVTKEALLRCAREAVAMARTAAPSVTEPGMVAEIEPVEDSVAAQFEIDPRDIHLADRVAAIFELEQEARREDPKRITNTVAGYTDGWGKSWLGNTEGTYLETERVRCSMGLTVIAQEGEVRQWASESRAGSRGYEVFTEIDHEEFATETARRALALLSAAPPPAGKFEAIIDPKITGLLVHEAFGHNCEADAVWSGQSILSDKVGQLVAAENVNIVDDPLQPKRNGSYLYDSEGTRAQRHVLLENGVLQGFLHSLETAAQFDEKPNGAARAGSPQDPPLVRMSNTYFEPGDWTYEEMLEQIKDGLYLTGGKWGYVYTARGQFTCNAEQAWAIKDGELGQHYRNVSFAGLTLDTLQKVTAVGNDLEFQMGGTCGKDGQGVPVDTGGPHLRLAEIVVGGHEEAEA